jgi:GNAT superfamily N-acetyltransferase
MTQEDMHTVIGWAGEEGWNPGMYDAVPLYRSDPHHSLMLRVNERPVASLGCVHYDESFAFIGLFIVIPEFRGHGYGFLLWSRAISALSGICTVGLNAVTNQIDNYAQSGFKVCSTNTRWQGKVPSRAENLKSSIHANKNNTILISDSPCLADIASYDSTVFNAPRKPFLFSWLTMPKIHVVSATENGEMVGYGVLSACKEGYKIAPLFADTPTIADMIYRALCERVCVGAPIQLDTNSENPDSESIAKRNGLTAVFQTARMYRDIDAPGVRPDASRTFGLTTLEHG